MLTVSLCAAEIDSDPKPGQAESVLKVKDLTGQYEGKVVDYLKVGAKEPTVVVWLTDEGLAHGAVPAGHRYAHHQAEQGRVPVGRAGDGKTG